MQASKVLTDVVECTDTRQAEEAESQTIKRKSTKSFFIIRCFSQSLLSSPASHSLPSSPCSLKHSSYPSIPPNRYNMILDRTPSILPFPPSPRILSSFSSHHLLRSSPSVLSFGPRLRSSPSYFLPASSIAFFSFSATGFMILNLPLANACAAIPFSIFDAWDEEIFYNQTLSRARVSEKSRGLEGGRKGKGLTRATISLLTKGAFFGGQLRAIHEMLEQ